MATLYLVRHGQASFGAANYDQLSTLGTQQAQQLGRYWQARGQGFAAVYTGTLQRHQQTLDGIAQTLPGLPPSQALPCWNEYDSHALIRCIQPQELGPADTPEAYRQHFRWLCNALAQWMSGVISPEGMPSWVDFSGAIRHALEQMRKQHAQGDVLLVSSGGPIATAVSVVLGCTPEVAIALNMRLRNTAVTGLSMGSKRLMLQTFNALNHLDDPAQRDWETYT